MSLPNIIDILKKKQKKTSSKNKTFPIAMHVF
jgi:hypothetical protein